MRLLLACAVLVWPAVAAGQTISVTAPASGANAVAAARDFATTAFQDPWDMSQRTDLGWFVHSVDQPRNGFSSLTFANGLFTGTFDTAGDPNLFVLETGFVGAAPTGKIGTNYPIDATTYRRFAIRMRLPQASQMVFFWSTNTIYDPPGLQMSAPVVTSPGWRYYFIDLAALGLYPGGSWTEPWSGTKRSLRFDPVIEGTPGTMDIDWIRLTAYNAALDRTITWTGTGPVDIYLAASNTPTSDPNQLLGLVASNVSGNSYTLYAGALEPGDYYVAVRKSGTTGNFSFSPGYYRVNATPLVTVTAPSDEGSSDDFATTQIGNPWDMNTLGDVDIIGGSTGAAIATVPGVVTEAGSAIGSISALTAANTTGSFSPNPCSSASDPWIYLLHGSYRGFNYRIDPTRYRILTAEFGIPQKARDICGGSVARIIWRVAGQIYDSVSDDIVVNSRADANVMDRLIVDMATLPVDPGSPNQLTWIGGAGAGIDSFRIDPHELVNPTPFFIKRVKLAALEAANTSYTVRWTATESAGTVNVYYDDDRDPAVKSFIGSTSSSVNNGSLTWNTSALPQGAEYYVYIEFNDGTNTSGAYSRWPVKINHSPVPTARIVPNRTYLNFGVTGLTRKTPAQTVRVTAVNAAPGQPCWTVQSDVSFVLVSPASGCGTGSFTVSLLDQNYVQTGVGVANITITSAGATNSPQYVRAWFRIYGVSARPIGVVDTPPDGATVSGSIGITGWALDDIGVSRVTLCRLPVTGESAPIDGRCGNGAEIYVGDAVFSDDARPDVEAASPTSAMNYRGGWGLLVLTNMLPNQGNGQFTFTARAFDIEGGFTVLGSRTIYGNNRAATEPFGAIDTPGQGQVISGTAYVNFGWALTPLPKTIPKNGSTITVYVDGQPIGHPTYNNYRSDIATLFPGLNNTNGAVGYLTIDTTAYANGVHTIAWGVVDNAGSASGIGSRFFTTFNTGSATSLTTAPVSIAQSDLGRTVDEITALPARAHTVKVRRGFDGRAPLREVAPVLRTVGVWHTELDRVEVQLADTSPWSSDRYDGYLVVDGRLSQLPVGSSLDRHRGVFAWQPGIGYLGSYEFVFIRTAADGPRERIPVRVVLEPRASNVRFARMEASAPFRTLFRADSR